MLPLFYPVLCVLSCKPRSELDDSIYFLYNFVMLFSPKHILAHYFTIPFTQLITKSKLQDFVHQVAKRL